VALSAPLATVIALAAAARRAILGGTAAA